MRSHVLGLSLLSLLIMGLAASSAAWAAPPGVGVETAEPLAEAELEPPELELPELEPPEPEPEPSAGEADEPPPPAPSLPSYDSDIPVYIDTPELLELPPEPELPPRRPKEGYGRIAVGSILLGGGVALVGVSMSMILIGEDLAVWIPGTVIGVGAMAAGLSSVVAGHLFHTQYREWAEPLGGVKAIPKSGVGLIGSGIICIGAGGFGVTVGSMSLSWLQDNDDPPYGQVMVPIAVASVVTGVGLFAAGVVRRRQFRRWDAQRALTPVLAPLGGLGRQPTGATFGIAGRF